VVRRRRDKLYAGLRVAQACDEGIHLVAGKLSAFAGLRPCAILISISSACMRYSAVTPKRAEATCLILLFKRCESTGVPTRSILVWAGRRLDLLRFSVLERAPSMFMARNVWCASG